MVKETLKLMSDSKDLFSPYWPTHPKPSLFTSSSTSFISSSTDTIIIIVSSSTKQVILGIII